MDRLISFVEAKRVMSEIDDKLEKAADECFENLELNTVRIISCLKILWRKGQFKMQTLHGYTVDETQWKSKGGGGQCNIAKKGGKEYFIKRLAFPRYPDSDNFKGAFKQQKIDICNDWYRRRQEIIRAIPGSGTGTTVKPIEYFREGPCYYEVANLIDVTSIPYDEIYKESKEDKARVMLTVAMSLADLLKKGLFMVIWIQEIFSFQEWLEARTW